MELLFQYDDLTAPPRVVSLSRSRIMIFHTAAKYICWRAPAVGDATFTPERLQKNSDKMTRKNRFSVFSCDLNIPRTHTHARAHVHALTRARASGSVGNKGG